MAESAAYQEPSAHRDRIAGMELPAIRGTYRFDAPLDRYTWFKVGGPADVLFRPADAEDLRHFLQHKPKDLPVTVIGAASNMIIRDGGIGGVVIKLGGGFAAVEIDGEMVKAGAAALSPTVAKAAQGAGLTGLEFLSGIPGSVGGALAMNAGAYGQEVCDVLYEAEWLLPDGTPETVLPGQLGYSYRHAEIPEGAVFVSARFKAKQGQPDLIAHAMQQIAEARETSQPLRTQTGGSTFKNPPGQKAWELIDQAGCRGMRHGKAQVSAKHCNFMINTGGATAADLEQLGEQVIARVREATGVTLEWEIRRVGKKND